MHQPQPRIPQTTTTANPMTSINGNGHQGRGTTPGAGWGNGQNTRWRVGMEVCKDNPKTTGGTDGTLGKGGGRKSGKAPPRSTNAATRQLQLASRTAKGAARKRHPRLLQLIVLPRPVCAPPTVALTPRARPSQPCWAGGANPARPTPVDGIATTTHTPGPQLKAWQCSKAPKTATLRHR